MSRWLHTCAVCSALGPYGYYRRGADGAHGYVWACPEHTAAVRALPGVEVPAPAAAVPASIAPPAAAPIPRAGQGSLF